jgi:hypothetical protein
MINRRSFLPVLLAPFAWLLPRAVAKPDVKLTPKFQREEHLLDELRAWEPSHFDHVGLEQSAGRIRLLMWQNCLLPADEPTELEHGRRHFLCIYAGITDNTGTTAWMTRHFTDWDLHRSFLEHLDRMLLPDVFDFTDEERMLLLDYRGFIAQLAQHATCACTAFYDTNLGEPYQA